jgi:Sec-independent protein translocase protein TatA
VKKALLKMQLLIASGIIFAILAMMAFGGAEGVKKTAKKVIRGAKKTAKKVTDVAKKTTKKTTEEEEDSTEKEEDSTEEEEDSSPGHFNLVLGAIGFIIGVIVPFLSMGVIKYFDRTMANKPDSFIASKIKTLRSSIISRSPRERQWIELFQARIQRH